MFKHDKSIDINELSTDLNSKLTKNINIFKSKNIKDLKDCFLYNDLFNYLINNYNKANNDINDSIHEYINKVFFN